MILFRAPRPMLAAASLALSLAACGDGVEEPSGQYVPAPRGPVTTPAVPLTVTDIFPATGSRGLVLNHCATCHAVACAAIGQRSEERWRQVEASHLRYNPGLSIEDRGKIFDYLKRHFNDTLPEPAVPERFLEGGCPEL
jgi:hypothetical protein